MLKFISIKNYQSLEDVTVALGGLTVIVGPSNTGKSALFRAMQALCFNQSGNDFITNGKTKTEITLEVDDWEVKWAKGKTASYTLNGTEYSRMGTSVPKDVQDALNIRKIDVDNLTLVPQFASQFDSPFLLTESSRKAAQVLARVTKLDVVLTATVDAKKDLAKLRTTIDTIKESITEKETEITQRLDSLDPRIEQWNNMSINFEELVTEYDSIAGTIDKLSMYESLNTSKPRVTLAQLAKVKKDVEDTYLLLKNLWKYEGLVAKEFRLLDDIESSKLFIAELRSLLEACPTCGSYTLRGTNDSRT